MKIYLDYIFLENLIVNILVSIQIIIFIKTNIKKINIIIGAIFLSLYTTLIYVLNNTFFNSICIKVIAIVIYCYITFKPKTVILLLKEVLYYLFFTFLYVGIIISISLIFKVNLESIFIKSIIYVISGIILYIFTNYLWKMWKSNIKYSDLTYTINIKGQEIIGFVDTGHNVKDVVTNLDVIFINKEYKEKLKSIIDEKKKIFININTVNNNTEEEGYIVKDIYFYKDNKMIGRIKRIVICFVNNSLTNKKYSALIGYNTYVEKIKGVTFC